MVENEHLQGIDCSHVSNISIQPENLRSSESDDASPELPSRSRKLENQMANQLRLIALVCVQEAFADKSGRLKISYIV